jgi:hypothetical protein
MLHFALGTIDLGGRAVRDEKIGNHAIPSARG